MATAKFTTVLAAALLVAAGGAWAETAGWKATSERTAGEAQAHAYYAAHRAKFAAQPLLITPEQVEAAVAQGRIERQASSPRVLHDGGNWALPATLMAKFEDAE